MSFTELKEHPETISELRAVENNELIERNRLLQECYAAEIDMLHADPAYWRLLDEEIANTPEEREAPKPRCGIFWDEDAWYWSVTCTDCGGFICYAQDWQTSLEVVTKHLQNHEIDSYNEGNY